MRAEARKLCIVAVLSLCLLGSASADLRRQIDGIIGRPSQSKVEFSVHVLEAASCKAVYDHNAGAPLIPASNMKIIITAAALKYLGPDFEYSTKVALCGDTLVIIGSGDPLLGDEATDTKHGRAVGWIFEDIVKALKKDGVKKIKDIIVDSTVFDDERVHTNWPKEQLNRWYACEVSGLNYNDNCIEISAKTQGRRVIVSVRPQTGYVDIVNQLMPSSQGRSTVGAYRTDQPNRIILKGNCRGAAGPFDVAIERPAAFFGYLLAERLRSAQIDIEGELLEKPLDSSCGDISLLTEFKHSLTDCLGRCNKKSLGLAAEALLKTIATTATSDGKNGSWKGGQRLISRYLRDIGIPENEFFIDDASGLSRLNELSANAITKVLSDLYKGPNWQLYKGSLAVGGVDGTISKYFKEPKYKGKIFGKTGYIAGVKSFSGVCSTEGGDYLFSILANNANGKTRAAINDIAEAIIDCR